MKERGSIVANKIVNIILILAGALILILVFPTLLNKNDVGWEACHQSVVLRGTFPDSFGLKDLPSLNCETKYVCITDKLFGKGDCKYVSDDYETTRITGDEAQQDAEINRIFAHEMSECWAMMGEGKLQIFTRGGTTAKKCSVCSVLIFDEELKEERTSKYVYGLGDYLVSKQNPQMSVSFAKFLNLGEEDVDALSKISLDTKAIVFFEIGKGDALENFFWGLEGAGYGIIGAKLGGVIGFIFGPVGTGTGALIGGAGGFVFGWFSGQKVGETIVGGEEFTSGYALIDYKGEAIKSLECKPF